VGLLYGRDISQDFDSKVGTGTSIRSMIRGSADPALRQPNGEWLRLQIELPVKDLASLLEVSVEEQSCISRHQRLCNTRHTAESQ